MDADAGKSGHIDLLIDGNDGRSRRKKNDEIRLF
jgi:hypothetical protein